MIRLVKGAYWDSEIKRAQVDGLDGLSGLHPQVPYRCLVPGVRAPAARRARRGLSAVRDPQRAHAGGDRDAGRRRRCERGRLRVPVPARHGRAAVRPGGRAATDGGLGAAMPHLRAGRHARDAARLPGAPPARERRQHVVREPHRRPDSRHRRAGRRPGRDDRRRREAEGALGAPHPAILLPRELYGASRRNSRGLDLSNEASLRDACAERSHGSAQIAWRCRAAALAGAARADEACAQPVARPGRSALGEVGAVVEATPRRSQPRSMRAAARAPAWLDRRRRRSAPPRWSAPPSSWSSRCRALIGLAVREAGKTAANAVGRGARGGRLPALLRGAGRGRDFDRRDAPCRSAPVVCISPWNFPLAIFVGQVAAALAAGNAVLAKPAEQTPLIAAEAVRAPARGRRSASARCSCCPAAARRSAPRWSPMRASAACSSPARPTSRGCCSARSPAASTRTATPVPLIAETGGQNAMIVDSSALAEQVVADVADVGVRQRRPALLGAARAVRAGRHRRAHARRCCSARCASCASATPARLATDVGPVIDDDARAAHRGATSMRMRARRDAASTGRVRGRPTRWARQLRRADADRDRPHRRADRARCSGRCCTSCATGATQLGALVDQINATGYGLTLRPAHAHRRDDRAVVGARRMPATSTSTATWSARSSACSRSAARASRAPARKPGGPLYLPRLCRRARRHRRGQTAPRRRRVETGGRDGSATAPRAAAPADDRARALCDWLAARPADAELARRCRIHLQRRPPAGPERAARADRRAQHLRAGAAFARALPRRDARRTARAARRRADRRRPRGVADRRRGRALARRTPGAVRDRVSTVADPFARRCRCRADRGVRRACRRVEPAARRARRPDRRAARAAGRRRRVRDRARCWSNGRSRSTPRQPAATPA